MKHIIILLICHLISISTNLLQTPQQLSLGKLTQITFSKPDEILHYHLDINLHQSQETDQTIYIYFNFQTPVRINSLNYKISYNDTLIDGNITRRRNDMGYAQNYEKLICPDAICQFDLQITQNYPILFDPKNPNFGYLQFLDKYNQYDTENLSDFTVFGIIPLEFPNDLEGVSQNLMDHNKTQKFCFLYNTTNLQNKKDLIASASINSPIQQDQKITVQVKAIEDYSVHSVESWGYAEDNKINLLKQNNDAFIIPNDLITQYKPNLAITVLVEVNENHQFLKNDPVSFTISLSNLIPAPHFSYHTDMKTNRLIHAMKITPQNTTSIHGINANLYKSQNDQYLDYKVYKKSLEIKNDVTYLQSYRVQANKEKRNFLDQFIKIDHSELQVEYLQYEFIVVLFPTKITEDASIECEYLQLDQGYAQKIYGHPQNEIIEHKFETANALILYQTLSYQNLDDNDFLKLRIKHGNETQTKDINIQYDFLSPEQSILPPLKNEKNYQKLFSYSRQAPLDSKIFVITKLKQNIPNFRSSTLVIRIQRNHDVQSIQEALAIQVIDDQNLSDYFYKGLQIPINITKNFQFYDLNFQFSKSMVPNPDDQDIIFLGENYSQSNNITYYIQYNLNSIKTSIEPNQQGTQQLFKDKICKYFRCSMNLNIGLSQEYLEEDYLQQGPMATISVKLFSEKNRKQGIWGDSKILQQNQNILAYKSLTNIYKYQIQAKQGQQLVIAVAQKTFKIINQNEYNKFYIDSNSEDDSKYNQILSENDLNLKFLQIGEQTQTAVKTLNYCDKPTCDHKIILYGKILNNFDTNFNIIALDLNDKNNINSQNEISQKDGEIIDSKTIDNSSPYFLEKLHISSIQYENIYRQLSMNFKQQNLDSRQQNIYIIRTQNKTFQQLPVLNNFKQQQQSIAIQNPLDTYYILRLFSQKQQRQNQQLQRNYRLQNIVKSFDITQIGKLKFDKNTKIIHKFVEVKQNTEIDTIIHQISPQTNNNTNYTISFKRKIDTINNNQLSHMVYPMQYSNIENQYLEEFTDENIHTPKGSIFHTNTSISNDNNNDNESTYMMMTFEINKIPQNDIELSVIFKQNLEKTGGENTLLIILLSTGAAIIVICIVVFFIVKKKRSKKANKFLDSEYVSNDTISNVSNVSSNINDI